MRDDHPAPDAGDAPEDSVEDHSREPLGLGDPDEPYLLPEINPDDEQRELPFCGEEGS